MIFFFQSDQHIAACDLVVVEDRRQRASAGQNGFLQGFSQIYSNISPIMGTITPSRTHDLLPRKKGVSTWQKPAEAHLSKLLLASCRPQPTTFWLPGAAQT